MLLQYSGCVKYDNQLFYIKVHESYNFVNFIFIQHKYKTNVISSW
jgi:hypothetical protein